VFQMAVQYTLSIDGPGVNGGNTAEPSTFTITVRDGHGQAVALRNDGLKVLITGPNNRSIAPQVKNNGDGTFTVTYQTVDQGQHDVVAILTAQTSVGISVGTDASKSRVYGPALEGRVQDNLPTKLFIESIGTDGQPMRKGGDPYVVKVTGPKGPVNVDLKDNGDGTYVAAFAPDDAGQHKIEVTLRDKQVANSPYTINVEEGADHKTSFIEVSSFVVRARTKRNQNMSRGGEKFVATLNGTNSNVQDNGNGTYTVSYGPSQAGSSNQVSVQVNSRDIVGSPFQQKYA